MPDDSVICADVCIPSLALFFPVSYFKSKMYILFPCNLASSKHLGIWGHTRVAFILFALWFPNTTCVLPTSHVFMRLYYILLLWLRS